MEDVKRPSKKETDEDLIKQQELFFKEKNKPTMQLGSEDNTKVHNSCQKSETLSKKQSSSVEAMCKQQLSTNYASDDIIFQKEVVVFDVKEHDVTFSEPFTFKPPEILPTNVNDYINKKIKISKFAARKKSKSIFEQILDAEGDSKDEEHETNVPYSVLIDGSGLLSDIQSAEVKKIHEENMAKISSMSKEEILQHQEQLKQHLKPDIVNFIKSRRIMKKGINSFPDNGDIKNLCKESDIMEEKELGEVLRNEGKEDCDALILEKVLHSESEVLTPPSDALKPLNASQNRNIELPEEAKELFEHSNKGYWRNMNKIEKEKLEWMTGLPKPIPVDLKTGYTARFNFEGKLLSREVDIPTYQGLHHHGEEPEVAGYSLEELFLLARSTLQSQRITALHTIAHILENNWYGMMDSFFDKPLLPMILQAGIVPLLRWALDDTSLTSVSATITAIHSLLISKPDMACLHRTFCWFNGHLMPQLEPQGLKEPNVNIEELTDADLIKLDVVKGFLRVDILPRFMYVLKTMCPPPLVCKLIIEVCARLAQHSTESANQIATYPGLMKLLFDKFLPINWHFVDGSKLTDSVNYCSPLYSVMSLVRVIASSSKDLALLMVQKYDLISNIVFYLTIQPVDRKLPPQDVQMLVIETLKTWQILLCYGLALNVFLDLFPIFLKQLDFCLHLDLNWDEFKHLKDFEYAIFFFKALEAVAIFAVDECDNRNSCSQALNVILKKSVTCLKKWLWQFSQESVSCYAMALLATCMDFVSTFYRKSHEGLICDDWEHCSAVKEVFHHYLVPCIKSKIFQNLLGNIKLFSLLLSTAKSGNIRDGKTVISVGSILWRDDVVPLLREGSPFPLLPSILSYILVYKSLFNDTENQILETILCNTAITEYLKKISSRELSISNWFTTFETHFIYQLIKLSTFVVFDLPFWHGITVSLLPTLKASQESLMEDLFENIVFNKKFLENFGPIMLLGKSSSIVKLNSSEICVMEAAVSRLPVIAKCYSSCFLEVSAILYSRHLFSSTELEKLSLLSTSKVLLPKDWCYAPISSLYQSASKRKSSDRLMPEEQLQIISSLQWIHLCHALNLPLLREIPGSVEFSYLCMVFLVDEDFFHDEKVKLLLESCFSAIVKCKNFNLSSIKWNDLNEIDDLYLAMLNQFEAVSYGDHLFGNFLLFPLQQSYPSRWKKMLLSDHSPALRFLGVPLSKLFAPVESYLEPVETDTEVLSDYLKVLASGILIPRCCPLIYLMAIHHLHHFLLLKSEKYLSTQKQLLSNILKSKKEWKRHILLYSECDKNAEYGFVLKENLSSEYQACLSNTVGIHVTL